MVSYPFSVKLTHAQIFYCIITHHYFNIFCVGGTDYVIQDYRTLATFVKSGKTFVDLPTKPVDDDIVECDKKYCLTIIDAILPDRVTTTSPDVCEVIIRDDDSK